MATELNFYWGTRPATGVSTLALVTPPYQKTFPVSSTGSVTAPVNFQFTYTPIDATPLIEGRVFLLSDNTPVTGWFPLTVTASGGTGTLKGGAVPKSFNKYYLTIRDVANTAITSTLAGFFYAGFGFLTQGQSNAGALLTAGGGTVPAALEYTSWVGAGGFAAVPAYNGYRTLANELATRLGCAVVLCDATQGATGIQDFIDIADTFFAGLRAAITDHLGGDLNGVMYRNGEGEAVAAPDGYNISIGYPTKLLELHTLLHSYLSSGRTLAQFPLWTQGMAGENNVGSAFYSPYWQAVMKGQSLIDTNTALPNAHYAATHRDATLPDLLHIEGISAAKAARRFAQAVAYHYGAVPKPPYWRMGTPTKINATTVEIPVVHSLGTDFTPSSDIRGYRYGVNGSHWFIPSSVVRYSATAIRMTILDKGSDTLIDYLYGHEDFDVTKMVIDNSPDGVALEPTTDYIVAKGADGALPTAVWKSAVRDYSGSAPTHVGNLLFAPLVKASTVFVSVGGPNNTLTSITFTADVGGIITPTPVESVLTYPALRVYRLALPIGASKLDIVANYVGMTYQTTTFHMQAINTADLLSTTETGKGVASNVTSALTVPGTNTVAGGCMMGFVWTESNPISVTGDEANWALNAGGQMMGTFNVSGVAANASNDVTINFAASSASTAIIIAMR